MNRDIILASKSETRIKLLRNAGISFEAVAHGVDEDEVKLSMSKNTPEKVNWLTRLRIEMKQKNS